jgi:ribosomal protein S18 acetylase RimI-like enzyme
MSVEGIDPQVEPDRKETTYARAYLGPEDLSSMLDLVHKTRAVEQLADYPNRVDLQEILQSSSVQKNTRLWFEREGLIAYALVDNFDNLLYDSSRTQLELLGDELVHWGEYCVRRNGGKSLDVNCAENDLTKIDFLTGKGFRRSGAVTVAMLRDLKEHLPEVVLPPGFSVRQVQGEREAEALALLHRSAFGSEYITTENRLAWMRVPEYEPALDLVAVAPDGSLVAYCMCSISEEQNRATGRKEGQTDPVGTHPRFQRMGLARALLATGLHLLKERGMEFATLGTDGENLAMQRAAESAGFHISCRKIWFRKEVKPE